jgi:tetratricopeptide (TPR) repeat protein
MLPHNNPPNYSIQLPAAESAVQHPSCAELPSPRVALSGMLSLSTESSASSHEGPEADSSYATIPGIHPTAAFKSQSDPSNNASNPPARRSRGSGRRSHASSRQVSPSSTSGGTNPLQDDLYAQAKKLQLEEKDLDGARVLFEQILQGDSGKLDSALKDLVTVLRQLGNHQEAAEAIDKYRNKCSDRAQTSLSNMQLELYKCLKNYQGQVEVAERLLAVLQSQKESGERTIARNALGRFEVPAEHKMARLYGVIGWAHMQLNEWHAADVAYAHGIRLSRKADGEDDAEMQVNRSVCLIKQGCFVEAQHILLRLLAHARGLQNGGTIKGVAGSALATKRRVLAVLRQLEAEYERLLGQLRQELNEQEQLESMVTAVDSLVGDDEREDEPKKSELELKKKNRGTTGKRREGESMWASQARLEAGFEHQRHITYNVIDENKEGLLRGVK